MTFQAIFKASELLGLAAGYATKIAIYEQEPDASTFQEYMNERGEGLDDDIFERVMELITIAMDSA